MRYYCQVQWDQLTEIVDEATFNNWIADTLIPSAERFIDGHLGHSFGTPGYGTILLDGEGRSTLFFPTKYTPLIGFSAGSAGGVGITMGDIKVYDQYVRWDGGNFPSGKQNVVFYGSYGYLDKDRVAIVPPDIQYVCSQLCANAILDMVRRNMSPELFRSILLTRTAEGEKGIGSLWAAPQIFNHELKTMLEGYRIHWVDFG